MIYLLFFVFLYCNADIILNQLYLSHYPAILNNEQIQNNSNFYYSIKNVNIFALYIYSFYIAQNIFYYNSKNKTGIALAFIYVKYILNQLLNFNITLSQYEFNRCVMWLFSTPLMLKMYSDVNNIKIKHLKIQYHIIPVAINIFIYPYKNTKFYYYFTGVSWILLLYFIKNLYKQHNLTFTNIYLFIWSIFMLLNIIEIFQISDRYTLNLYYSYADMISKLMTNIIVNDYNEKEFSEINNMDLQSVQFISYMIKNIKKYKIENAFITPQCHNFIDFTTHRFLVKIPENKKLLEQELLKKILPFNFDKDYIENIESDRTNTKQFNMICILFTDIVNYTELAKNIMIKLFFKC